MTSPAGPVSSDDWSQQPERSNAWALGLMRWIALRCGRSVARCVLHPITLYFLLFAPQPRRQSKRYLARALGRAPRWRDVYRHFHTFAATILDRIYLLNGRMDLFDIHLHDGVQIDSVLGDGRGAFLFGAHVGSFEVLRAVSGPQRKRRIAMVMYPDNARLINQTLRAVAPDDPPDIIALGRRGSMLAVRDWLDAGGLAGLLADRALPVESDRSAALMIDFLGHPARFSDGPFRLAALLQRQVIFMVGLYAGGNRYEVRFTPLADFRAPAASAAERERQIHEAVSAYAAQLAVACQAQPCNWFNFHDFWQETPP